MKHLELRGAVAVVTGAASGIGRATALLLAERGCHLALADRDAAGLEETAVAAALKGVRVSRHRLDVADAAAVAALPAAVLAQHGMVSVLVNNAGVALVGTFEEMTLEEFRWLIDINFLGLVGMTKAFLPALRQAPQAQIVNISSIFGIIAPPHEVAYVASKFAVRGFSESLRHELHGSTIGITVVHPGGIHTNIALSARIAAAADAALARATTTQFTEQFLRTSPGRAADLIVRAIERRRPRLLIGGDAWLVVLLQWLMPVRYWNVMRRRFEKAQEAVKRSVG